MKEFTGYQYLLIDIANNFGLDKELFENRIIWAETNLNNLEQLVDKADNKPQYIKAVMALRDVQQGKSTGHIVYLDAVCSGIQIMSAATGCIKGASITGLVNPNMRSDAYTSITNTMNVLLHDHGINVNVSRQNAKDAIMPRFYGSKETPKKIFGEGIEHEMFLEACRQEAPGANELLEDLVNSWQPYALKHSWQLPDGFECHVKVMELVEDCRIEVDELNHSTFTYQYMINKGSKTGLSNAANVIHSIDAYILRCMIRRCNYDWEQIAYAQYRIEDELLNRNLGATKRNTSLINKDFNLTKYIGLYESTGMVDIVILNHLYDDTICALSDKHLRALNKVLSKMLTYKPFPLVTIHDAFGAHVNNLNTVRYWYKELLAEISESTIIQSILSDIYGMKGEYKKLSNSLGDKIRQSNYALS